MGTFLSLETKMKKKPEMTITSDAYYCVNVNNGMSFMYTRVYTHFTEWVDSETGCDNVCIL